MTFLSLYKKTWPGNKFAMSFLHDSVHCEHCVKGKINLASPIKNNCRIRNFEPPPPEDLSRSFFHQSHQKSFTEIKYDSIPESSFSGLGVKLTKSVVAKLRQGCDRRSPCKKNNCENKKLLQKHSKTENKRPVDFNINICPLVKEKKELKKQKIPLKKPTLPSELIKIKEPPTKGTLKRKRWTLQKLKQSNLNYEDDLFEDQEFCSFESIIEADSDPEQYQDMRTPQISLSPVRDGSSTPSCNDCYSPGELFSNRKEAEEYIFRRAKRRKLKLQDELERSSAEPSPEKPPLSEAYTRMVLEQTKKALQKVALKAEECEDSNEDEYFTDNSDSSD